MSAEVWGRVAYEEYARICRERQYQPSMVTVLRWDELEDKEKESWAAVAQEVREGAVAQAVREAVEQALREAAR